MFMLCAIPHRNEASENNNVADTNNFTSPKRRVRKPVNGSAMALLTAKDVITQVLWS
jgi:septal ring factor EnvC (AmiA/AmiB activator)